MLDLSLNAIPLVFLDFETTGLTPYSGDRVCEIALQRVVGPAVELSLAALVDPERPLGDQSFSINKISAEELAGAPKFADLAQQIVAALRSAVFVAHNAPFDLEFLDAELRLAGITPPIFPVIDTLPLARRLMPMLPSHSLSALAQRVGAPPPSHRAMDDVVALRAVFADLVSQLAGQGITTLGELLHYARGFGPSEPEPLPPPAVDWALRTGRRLRVVYSSRTLPQPTERLIRPIEIVKQKQTLFLRAYCYLRQDLRLFMLDKLISIELADE